MGDKWFLPRKAGSVGATERWQRWRTFFRPTKRAERKFGLVTARRAKHLVDVSKKFVLIMVGGAAEQEQVIFLRDSSAPERSR